MELLLRLNQILGQPEDKPMNYKIAVGKSRTAILIQDTIFNIMRLLCRCSTKGGGGGAGVECLTRDRGAAGSSLTGVTALCPLTSQINPSLVLVQPRKTRPFITEGDRELIIATYPMSQKLRGAPRLLFGQWMLLIG